MFDNIRKKYNKAVIVSLCEKYGIKNYQINEDMSIDVGGDVDLANTNLSKIPVTFGKVTGNFYCQNSRLTALNGCPYYVGGKFTCSDNNLVTLEHCPKHVGGVFRCANNHLTTLEHCPADIFGDFDCSGNEIENLHYSPKNVSGDYYCHKNKITSLTGCPSRINGVFWCSDNSLNSLEGFPIHVDNDVNCSGNELRTLDGLYVNFSVGGRFNCHSNLISEPAEYGRLLFGYIGGIIITNNKKLAAFLNKNKNPPKKDLPRLLSELRKIHL